MRPLDPHATARLGLSAQIGYAAAELGVNTVETVLRLYLLFFYTKAVGLSAGLASVAVAVAIVWDAVTDPWMGQISDRTVHRFGGRRGYLPLGGLWLALGVAAVFLPPTFESEAGKFWWLLGSFCFLNTGMTVLSVPYMAMAGEMTSDPHQRAVLFGWRFVFANLGALAAAVLPFLFLGEAGADANGDSSAATPGVSLVAAGLVLATAAASFVATRRVPVAKQPLPHTSLLSAFVVPLRNPTFRPLLLAYVIATTGIGVNATTFLYYYEHCLELPAAETQVVLAVFLGMFTLSILAWVQLAKRFGKRRPLVLGALVLGIGTTLLYVLVPAGAFTTVLVVGALGLGAFVGSIVLIDTMLTDVLDHDLVRTRQLRSGAFFGVWRFASKLARALSVVAVGAVLDSVGFVEQAETQTEQVETALVVLFGPGVGCFFVLAGVVLWRYRFVDTKQRQVRRILARRAERRRREPEASRGS